MNHTYYRLVWNDTQRRYLPRAERTRARCKQAGSRCLTGLCATVVLATAVGYTADVQAAPTGGSVTQGQGSIHQSDSTTLVTQQSTNLSINWTTFNIATGEVISKEASADYTAKLFPEYADLCAKAKAYRLGDESVTCTAAEAVRVIDLVEAVCNSAKELP